MRQITHLFSSHGATLYTPLLRALHRHPLHALLVKLTNPAIAQTLLLAGATLLFVLACLGLILVSAWYTH
ncbi:hypothetical protein [Dyella acidiphila]|uniref:Uncharacterized protein n=1 Tax=Dyella acidiphila TaxID=2775866 RepID=A0ABR9GA70_9GAMM|nr:hypothetical protein [Dyella acidiphila]MBE1160936.1 hypothetical protein [Dyella acidiphila]